ncbi:hypothetical protein H480_19348 [Amycolatopsis vancoresmycina DSM 44592]|uniref:Uncharacterized protein n=1 Tax=Amycolatopsis vancoresmycina DSM 44592 TaxID=1292037 RepID=R1I317_9PSEU|nr:hypothetical protein H480_19348 [Amycolatopsis vancoresmycina DSM 44592]
MNADAAGANSSCIASTNTVVGVVPDATDSCTIAYRVVGVPVSVSRCHAPVVDDVDDASGAPVGKLYSDAVTVCEAGTNTYRLNVHTCPGTVAGSATAATSPPAL